MIPTDFIKLNLNSAQYYADQFTGCKKVAVGSLLLPYEPEYPVVYGANIAVPNLCKETECHRVEVYGEDSKEHRLPSDCRALHSEIDAITQAARRGIPTKYSTLFITRYPCEACARAIACAGVKLVYYGREQEISEETALIFKVMGVEVHHVPDWTYEDTTR